MNSYLNDEKRGMICQALCRVYSLGTDNPEADVVDALHRGGLPKLFL